MNKVIIRMRGVEVDDHQVGLRVRDEAPILADEYGGERDLYLVPTMALW